MAPAFGSRQLPLVSAGPHVPLYVPPPVGDQPSMRQVPLAPPSKLKPWMWNVQTCGAFASTGLLSPAPSWIFTSPLFPGGSAYAGLTARNRSARAAMSPSTPVDLRMDGPPRFRWRDQPAQRHGKRARRFPREGPPATDASRASLVSAT